MNWKCRRYKDVSWFKNMWHKQPEFATCCQKLSFVVARGEILRKQVVFVEIAAASVAEIGKLWRRRYRVVVEEVQRAAVKGTTSQKVQFARYADNCC